MTRICVLSTSPSRDSRSRESAKYVVNLLEQTPDITVDYIDLQETPIDLYPGQTEDAQRSDLIRRFNSVDGWIIAGAVYNGGASAHIINFLHFALDSDKTPHGRPFFLIVSAGGNSSLFAFDELGARIRREVKAVEVGAAVLVTKDVPANEARLKAQVELFLPLAELHGR
ncbi:MAG: NAD(P)H-dependent oxidoreductase [Armatimonadetes bacterium]|nr:NAD(P)H-dependent oxidoreductase [Armatimonadota bacterium]